MCNSLMCHFLLIPVCFINSFLLLIHKEKASGVRLSCLSGSQIEKRWSPFLETNKTFFPTGSILDRLDRFVIYMAFSHGVYTDECAATPKQT